MKQEMKDKLANSGYTSLKQAHKDMAPDISYHGFRSRVAAGASLVEAGTAPRSARGRPVKVQEEQS